MFESIPQNVSFPAMETKILEYWQENQIYEKSLEARAGNKPFVFYEGPPTANGMPHPGHCLTRAIKDVFPRYRTMRGYYCERKAGWDTHGLPVEVEVCKELGIHSKEEIENYGVEPFIHKCQASVWRYMQEWERLTQRLGFWVNLEEAYVTYHKSFVESVWWSLKNLYDRGLLYQGHKIVWWWAQGGTALSSGEVGQGYRQVADPSVYVRFPLLDEEDTALLVWTTTPWTLPSNQFAAVHPELSYATVQDEESGEKLIVAEALVEAISAKAKHKWKVVDTQKGEALLGKRYRPPFDYYYKDLGNTEGTLKTGEKQHIAWRIVAADFVTTDSGTGLVHQAPAFGEVDYEVLAAEQDRFEPGEGPALICSVGPDGKFTDEAPDYQGRWVKEADKDISRELKERGILFLLDQYLHDYPFCWRAEDDPLIQYPRESWFIRTTKFKDQMLANNQQINWLPEHIRDGRFGNFLESNVDWALSRERYWGTPLPIWVCQETGKGEAVASYAELQEKPGAAGFDVWEKAKAENPDLVDDLMIHKPYIDEITYDSPFAEGARMKRVPEVIDCWYDSGAMPFAQWGYPHNGEKNFDAQFPADFISEAIDQTRGWFYSQLAISTLLFGKDEEGKTEPHAYPHPFKNCIVLGLMLGEDGQKMSKSKRNYREPTEIFDRYGADALRWYLYANQPPWTSIRYNEQSIKDSIPEFLLRLWNVYSFFVIYANIDGFEPEKSVDNLAAGLANHFDGASGARSVAQRSELDRWILSELNRMVETVTSRMDAYDNYNACAAINEFVDGLSNWYVRRSRDRFWAKDKQSADKLDAYWTLYECLLTTCQVIAPFVPFLSDTLWQNLAGIFGEKAALSVHLCDFPEVDTKAIDTQLSQRMELLREVASLGRQARMNEKLKVRQPLSKVEVVLADNTHCDWLESHSALLCEELNVKEVAFTQDADEYINYQIQPNFKRLGPRVGKLLPTVKKVLGQTDATALLNTLQTAGAFTLTIEGESLTFDNEDIQVRLTAKEGWAAAQGKLCVVVLNTELTPELIQEGYIKDLVRLIQDKRKELDLEYTAQIEVGIVTESTEVGTAVEKFADYIQSETLAKSVHNQAIAGVEPNTTTIADSEVRIYVKQV
ncbi:isoleucine--tRNA ligase [Bremerella cremea]|uniref:Isoleucine--tRNA ligase n=1 Tax=Blastopirellula marina TaxID=124 RepID=A0A2S8FBR8_9BACT|nr:MULTISPECIES: isoleucine--tRNA ligase [Pirellulaceae]PQO29582.1 isoleucine--tRNA ligase [Blastopirellula marina]RCS42886.1 isoleucine--tRNA ligase [Bremerella cremea]